MLVFLDPTAGIEVKQAEASALRDRINQLEAKMEDQSQRLDRYRQRVCDLETREDRRTKEEKRLKAKRAFAERFNDLDGLLSRVTDWLKHRALDEQPRREGEDLLRRNDDSGLGW